MMRLVFDKERELVIFRLESNEIIPARTLFQAIIDDEKSIGNPVPASCENFLGELVCVEKSLIVTFGFKYFGIVTRYIESVLSKVALDGGETEYIEQFLGKLKFYVLKKSLSKQFIHLDNMVI